MNYSRRKFIKDLSIGAGLVLSSSFQHLSAAELYDLREKVGLRFLVASDCHYGQPDTDSDAKLDEFIKQANYFHLAQPLDFCVINGDIIHDEPKFLAVVKAKFNKLKMPYYVTQGNHDKVSSEVWEDTWGIPVNHQVNIKKNGVILVITSNEEGIYLSPDLVYLKEQLEASKKLKNLFLFVHIPQQKWTSVALENPAFADLIKDYPNVRAVFHGHDHTQDTIYFQNNIPFIYDSHIGGNWGTDYNGFRIVEVLKDRSLITYMMNPTLPLDRQHI